MTLQQLTYLVKVAECGNITEAAEQLYISQPSMSTAISNLEKEMGITAFNRTKKGVTVTRDKKVVLGLVTTKSSVLESKKAIIERIHEAEKYVPLDRLYLSPQCGFASCEIGNKLTEEQQWAKLRLVKEIAEEVWDKDGHIG